MVFHEEEALVVRGSKSTNEKRDVEEYSAALVIIT